MARCVITYRDKEPGVEALAGCRVVSRELGQDAGICAVGELSPGGSPEWALFLQAKRIPATALGRLLTERAA